MGYIRHRLLIDQLPILEPGRSQVLAKLEEWRASLPPDWQRLVIGPVLSIANGDEWVVFLPDGSKEGWEPSRRGYEYAKQFADIFLDSRARGTIEVTWGDDDPAVIEGLSFGDD